MANVTLGYASLTSPHAHGIKDKDDEFPMIHKALMDIRIKNLTVLKYWAAA